MLGQVKLDSCGRARSRLVRTSGQELQLNPSLKAWTAGVNVLSASRDADGRALRPCQG